MDIDAPLNEDDIDVLFNVILRRSVNNDYFKKDLVDRGTTWRQLIIGLRDSEELAIHIANERGYCLAAATINDYQYRIPNNLSASPANVRKVILVGSCLLDDWPSEIMIHDPNVNVEKITFNNASTLPDIDSATASQINFQILQIPLRSILHEADYFGIKYSEQNKYEDVFGRCCDRLALNLAAILKYNIQYGITSFVMNFANLQQNPMGRLHNRYSLNNMVYFIEKLNERLYNCLNAYTNVYMIDWDQVINTYGKRFFQDDSVMHANHGSYLTGLVMDMDGDRNRLEPVGNIGAMYAPQGTKYIRAAYEEAAASYRSLLQQDSIKMVIFDLDDTLWRGVAADVDVIGPLMTEGWPLGILEAASYLWRRGILIAIVSKNDEEVATTIWSELYESRFSIENFVVRKINWASKQDNIRDILSMVNLLPRSVLFVDDNPIERSAIKMAFPDMRVMDAPLACWRRVLLWSAETQQAAITEESIARTDMIQAQIKRDEISSSMDRHTFLNSLNLKITVYRVCDSGDIRFSRCFELLNKTNQFNTTGIRWTPAEIGRFFSNNGYIIAVDAADKYVNYGIVGVLMIGDGNRISQFVLSCRVFGMEVEHACIMVARRYIENNKFDTVEASLVETSKNKLCLNIYRDTGFEMANEGLWIAQSKVGTGFPKHISIESFA
jgi:FkbH-like protein